MKYEFYADVYLMSNIVMDFLALYAVNELLGREKRKRRLFCCSLTAGALGLLLFLFLRSYMLYKLIMHFIVNPLMITMCFLPKDWKSFLEEWFFTYLMVLFLGGAVDWLYQTKMHGNYYEICLLLSAVPLLLFILVMKIRKRQAGLIYTAVITHNGRKVRSRALYDTGNLLQDPYRQEPVHVLGERMISAIGGEEALAFRLVPFHSIGKARGMMKTATVESLEIILEEKNVVLKPAVLGFVSDSIFEGNSYDMILNGKTGEALRGGQNPLKWKNRNGEKQCT